MKIEYPLGVGEVDLPCEVCGLMSENCICPECPKCGEIGRALCYGSLGCGLVLTAEQESSKLAMERQWAEDAAREAAFWAERKEEGEP